MEEMEIIEIEYSESTVDTGNILVDLAIQLGITTAAVIVGNAICYGVGEAVKAIKNVSKASTPMLNATKVTNIGEHKDNSSVNDNPSNNDK
ncbi:hypothetical protein SAMN04487770_12369 [Butyrivibrio sp. ob235]|uniref:hypothetical protein n=1 Tax=Butyrivibrio sp. ob235 TaxID=1761780 RepID=UPI0008C80D44|nr:hypothetical protein [Butyrivibrio sp. ob235]SEM02024.1 hypothetical protein SAMN04487770_12369 [Butyrivibrio sp. ob235]